MESVIDAHIHLDHYQPDDLLKILSVDSSIKALISVSFDIRSCIRNLELSQIYEQVKPAFGWHPEQPLTAESEFSKLFDWMIIHIEKMAAVGEVGLPYYSRLESNISPFPLNCYIDILERFIVFAKQWQKPIVLHAIYDDAPIVCDLLEKHSVEKAHFHWFKGDRKTISRMVQNGYFISITPDVLYEEEIRELVELYPLDQMMVETDGPWPFEGPFQNQLTHPSMIHSSIQTIAKIKKLPVNEVYKQLYKSTEGFYNF